MTVCLPRLTREVGGQSAARAIPGLTVVLSSDTWFCKLQILEFTCHYLVCAISPVP